MKRPGSAVANDFLRPVAPRTLSDLATERLRTAIQMGALQPGAALVERDLATRLGMSRVPVREAIQRLVEEGLLKKNARRGTSVYLPSIDEIEEITSLRVLLEQFVVERAVARWTPENEAALLQLIDDMREAAGSRDRRRLSELDNDFHAALWQIAGHAILIEIVAGLRQRVTRLLYETIALMADDALSQVADSHAKLLRVLRRRDVPAARAEMTSHILAAKARILSAHARTVAATDSQPTAGEPSR